MAVYPINIPWREPGRSGRAPGISRKRTRTLAAVLLFAVLALAAIVASAVAVMVVHLRPSIPTIAQIASYKPVECTRIMSSDGVLLAKLQIENRKVVPLKQIASRLVDATIAVEDARFFEHGGIDPKGIIRSAWANMTGGDSTGQGGSTITQQLARNVSEFGISRRKTIERKIREAMTAVRIEQALDKREILELYLNQIYYGNGAYGVEAAARTYFGKPASQLTLGEAALLAGIPQRPAKYSPYESLDAAKARRNVVLSRMLETGKITKIEFQRAREEPIKLAGLKTNNTVYRAPYFVDWIVGQLTDRFGRDALYSGMTVVTTLNWRIQEAAERAVRGPLGFGATQAALVSIDPHTGHVRAMVGGRDYQKTQFNAVTQGLRQPGSAFKPIVYAAAFDAGIVDVTSRVRDAKLQLALDERKSWTVRNYGGGYANKERTVLDAIRYSINTIAVDVGLQAGLDRIVQYARAMGVSTELPEWPSLTLGAASVRPLELCSAYGIFAASGERYTPAGVLEVRDSRGERIYRDDPLRRYVKPFLSQSTLDQMNFALREVVQSGSGHAAAVVPNAFGKTGTTSDFRDAWFVGYTPELATAVWTAAPFKDAGGRIRFRIMYDGTGGHLAAPVWARFMASAVRIQKEINLKNGRRWRIEYPKYEVAPPEEVPQEDQPVGVIAQNAPDSFTLQTSTYAQYSLPSPSVYSGGRVYPPQAYVDVPANTQTAPSPRENVVEAAVCADSGQLAGSYCPVTVMRRMPAATESRMGICRLHRAPQGEPLPGIPDFDRFGERDHSE